MIPMGSRLTPSRGPIGACASVFLLLPAAGASQALPQDLATVVTKTLAGANHDLVWQVGTPLEGVASAWKAVCRGSGVQAFFVPGGVRVAAYAAPDADWSWGLDLIGYGRVGRPRDVGAPVARGTPCTVLRAASTMDLGLRGMLRAGEVWLVCVGDW